MEKPCKENAYLTHHVALMLSSYRHLLGYQLIADDDPPEAQAKRLFFAPFVVVSHDTAEDPIFNYANQKALDLFELSWLEFTRLPSRRSAEPVDREERERLLNQVSQKGFIDDYAGVRISKSGKRFRIEQATVWNLIDEAEHYRGQAATFSRWRFL